MQVVQLELVFSITFRMSGPPAVIASKRLVRPGNLIPASWIAATTHYFQAKLLRRDRKTDYSPKSMSRCKSTRQNSCVVTLRQVDEFLEQESCHS